ncbi:MAG: hypothetical protein M1831_007481 [Alyxoria varia]|nr:MAG: hypothetical protein M1831_007481 [Alyxoria varia]
MLVYHARQCDTTLDNVPPKQKLYASTGGGAAAAVTTAAIFPHDEGGRANILPGALTGSLTGFFGHKLYDRFMERPQRAHDESKQQPTIWQSLTESRMFPMKKLSNEEYANMMREKLVRVDAEIAIIDEDIAQLIETKSKESSELPQGKS